MVAPPVNSQRFSTAWRAGVWPRENQYIRAREEGDNMAATNEARIKADLMAQLKNQRKEGQHFIDLVRDYIYLYNLKKKMQTDIDERGLRYTSVSGNGVKIEKPNENVQNILKVNAQMLKILSELNLKEPSAVADGDNSDYL